MPNDQNQTPSAFRGWDKLFVKQGEPIPPGWTHMASQSSPTQADPEPEPMIHLVHIESGKHGSVPQSKAKAAVATGKFRHVTKDDLK